MRYLGNNSSNVLGLRNLNTGNQLKAGDQTVLRYRLTDSNNDVLNLQGQTAKVFLKQSGKTIRLTTVDVTQDLEVRFAIDNVLYPGSYELEIVVADNYFFPSDNSERIIIYPSYLSLVDEEIEDIIQAGDTTLADVREYIMTFVQNAIDNSTYVAGANVTIDENNVISAIDHELRDLVKTKQKKLVAGDNIELDADGKISATDTVYNDSALRSEVEKKQDRLTAGENIVVDEDGTIHAVDTVYDDSDVRSKLESVQDSITWGENIVVDEDGTVHAVDNDTVYDDTKIKQQLNSVSQHIDELIRGDITIQDFIDRLAVLEADMRTIKQRTSTLVSDMDALEAIVDNIGDVDLSDILTVLDTIQTDILELEKSVGDTTLATDVANIQSFISELSNKVDGLIYVGPQPVDPTIYRALTHILADIANLYSQLEGGVPADYDESELIAKIESLEGLINGYIAEGVYDDRTLQKRIDEVMAELNTFEQYVDADLMPTIGQLNDSLADIEAMRDNMLDLITSDVADLREQIGSLDEHVSDIATEYSIRALTDRMEELENIAYYFEGASEDVKNWLFENNAKALRFSGEGVYDPENLWLKADEYWRTREGSAYHMNDYRIDVRSRINPPTALRRAYRVNQITTDKGMDFNQHHLIHGAVFNKSSVDLSNKIMSFRFNPTFFSSNYSDNPFTFVDQGYDLVIEIINYTDNEDNVYDYHRVISNDEIVQGDGQVQFTVPKDYEVLYIFPISRSWSRSSSGLNDSRLLTELNAMGLWVIEDLNPPVDPGGDEPGDEYVVPEQSPVPLEEIVSSNPEGFDIPPVHYETDPNSVYVGELLDLVDQAITETYTGDNPIDSIIHYGFDKPLEEGYYPVSSKVIFEDGNSLTVNVPTYITFTDTPKGQTSPFVGYLIENTSSDYGTKYDLFLETPRNENTPVFYQDIWNFIIKNGPNDERLYDFIEQASWFRDGSKVLHVDASRSYENPWRNLTISGIDFETGINHMSSILLY